MASSIAWTAFGRLSVPLEEELAVGAALEVLDLDLRRVRGLVQGAEVDLLGLRNGNPLKRGASADVWLELGPPAALDLVP